MIDDDHIADGLQAELLASTAGPVPLMYVGAIGTAARIDIYYFAAVLEFQAPPAIVGR